MGMGGIGGIMGWRCQQMGPSLADSVRPNPPLLQGLLTQPRANPAPWPV